MATIPSRFINQNSIKKKFPSSTSYLEQQAEYEDMVRINASLFLHLPIFRKTCWYQSRLQRQAMRVCVCVWLCHYEHLGFYNCLVFQSIVNIILLTPELFHFGPWIASCGLSITWVLLYLGSYSGQRWKEKFCWMINLYWNSN